MPIILTPHSCVPRWTHTYIYSNEELANASASQQQFYKEYKDAFFHGVYYDLNGNTNYCFILLFDICDEYHNGNFNLDKMRTELVALQEAYQETAPYVVNTLIKAFLKNKRYAEAWSIKKQSGVFVIDDIIKFELLLEKSLIDSTVIKTLAGVSSITPYGRDYIDDIFALTEPIINRIEKEKGCRYSSIFIQSIKWDEYVLPEYESYYPNKKDYKNYFELDQSQSYFRKGTDAIPHTVRHGIQAHLQTIVRQAENTYRENHGLPKVGEGWIGETELYYFVKELLPKCTVLHHARPEWLKPQHLDILVQDHNIAIEYQGEQHFEPIEYFGGQDAFEANVRRDAMKREKCEANDCVLICTDKTHSQEHIKKCILKAIKIQNSKNTHKQTSVIDLA